jgi:acyl-CoA synthetase (AMP-forming)/AMP-acid ligase II
VNESPYLPDWLRAHAERRPEAPAVATPALRVSYGELWQRVQAMAGALREAGVGPGARVMLAVPNSPAAVAAGLAVLAAGATTVEVNREWNPAVLADIVQRSKVGHAFVGVRDLKAWRAHPVLAALRPWVVSPGPPPAAPPGAAPATWVLEDGRLDPALGAPPPLEVPALHPEAPALVLFTSGSTGRPRGVVQLHRNVDANTRAIVQYLGLSAEDRALLILPLYYCYGRSVLQTHLHVGGSVFLDGRFAFPRVVMEALASEGCTGFAGVPLTFEILRRQVDLSTIARPRLRYLTQAGGAMAPETIDWVREAFRPAELFVMYGQTEATARLSQLPPAQARAKRGSIGIAIPGVELRVVDDAGRELPRGEVGQLVARGDNVTPGYLDEPEDTAAILHDGWLWTGDLAIQDADGFFFHRGRSKEILKVGGQRVSPVEIEQVVAQHPEVAEAAVVGAPDALKGEVPVAWVVARPGCRPAPEVLAAFCRERMPPYQVPASFTLIEALPRNEAGKLLRTELARKVADRQG